MKDQNPPAKNTRSSKNQTSGIEPRIEENKITEADTAIENLPEMEEIVRSLSQQSLFGILIYNQEEILYANNIISDITGFSIEELRNRSLTELMEIVHPEQRDFVRQQIDKKISGDRDTLRKYDFQIIRKDGEDKWVQLYSDLVEYNGNKALLAFIWDISISKRIEKALEESKEKYRRVVDNANDGIFIIQEEKIKFVNRRGDEIIGLKEEDLLEQNFHKFIHPANLAEILEIYDRFFQRGEFDQKLESRLMKPSGSIIEAELNISRTTFDDEIAALVIVRDITDRKKAEQAVRESEKKYRMLAELAQDMIIVHDLEGNIIYANRAATELCGVGENDILNCNILDFLDENQIEKVQKRREERLKGDAGLFLYETEIVNHNGKVIPIEVSSTAFSDETGEMTGILLIARNITERAQVLRALRESEFKYRILFESAPDGVFLETIEGKILDCNSAALEMYGYTKKEMLNLRVHDIVPAEVVEQLPEMIKTELETGELNLEALGMRKNGEVFPTEVYAKVISIDDDKRVLTFVKDISARKNAEAALRESEKKYHNFFDNAQIGMFRTSLKDGTAIEANDRVIEMFGFKHRDEVIGKFKTIDNYVDAKERDRMLAELKQNGVVRNFETGFYKKDNSVVWLRFTGWLISEEDVIEGVAIDISEEKETQKALKESEAKYRHFIEHSNDALYLLDEDKFTLVNNRFCQLLGVTPEEVVAPDFNFINLVHPSSRALIEERARLIEIGEKPSLRYEFAGISKDGRKIEFEASISYIEQNGRTITQGILHDISERKKLEEQIRQTQKIEAIGRLAGGIAHDFNNLLTAIMGHVELIEMRLKEGDPLERDVTVIRRAAERAAGLTKQLLAFSRKQALQPRVINLNEIIVDMDQMLSRLISEDIDLKTIPYQDLPNVKADPGQIECVIMNLVINARDAMESGGRLTIETGVATLDEEYCKLHSEVKTGRYCTIAVSDTGTGMSKEIMEKVFEPFFTTKEIGKGTGLGLATVHGIVKQSGGHVSIYSELNKGTTIKVYLPSVQDRLMDKETEKRMKELLRGNETILLVEDEDSVREMAVKALKKLGYKVFEAANGGEALLLTEDSELVIDLVVTDVIMPRLSGEKLVERLRKKQPGLKVLFMSGYSANIIDKIQAEGKEVPFLQKPFGPTELVRRVRETLDN